MRLQNVFRTTAVLVVLSVIAASGPAAEPPAWKAGLARARITPQKPIWLAGYSGRNHPAEGTMHDLWVKVLALETPDGRRGVVVTSDLLGMPHGMYERIVAELKQRCGLDRSQVMLTASHTHSGPVLRDGLYDIYPLDDKQRALIEEYSDGLEKTIVATVAKALEGMAPAVLAGGEGTCPFAGNRRNNREANVAAMTKQGAPLKGPSDHSVPVLTVRSPDGKLRAVVFGYACHNTTLNGYQWSGDYAGFAQLAVETAHPEAAAMFYIGCGADQNPLPRRSVDLCRKYGDELAAAVDAVLAKPMRTIEPQLRTAMEIIELAFDGPPPKAKLEKTAAQTSYLGRWARRLLGEMQQGKAWPKGHPYPIQVWRLGQDQLWITLGGEVVVDYSLMFKQKYGPTTWVAGYTNDVMAYIPSHRVWQEGGYEAGAFSVYGLPTERWKEDIQQRITDGVDRLVKQVQK